MTPVIPTVGEWGVEGRSASNGQTGLQEADKRQCPPPGFIQWVKLSAAGPEKLNSIPRTHMVEKN